MVGINGNTQRHAIRQARRRRRRSSYDVRIRTVTAARAVKEDGWTAKRAASWLRVNPSHVGCVAKLSDDDQKRLLAGELTVAAVYQDYRQRLADQRAQRLAKTAMQDPEPPFEAIRKVLDNSWLDEQEHFQEMPAEQRGEHIFQSLQALQQWLEACGESRPASYNKGSELTDGQIEKIITVAGPDRVLQFLDKLTAPQRVAAE